MRDAIVVGAGHNGLVAAAYLARAGLSVEVLEARPVIGGVSATEELIPGYRSSSCAFVVGLLRPQIIRDLELKRHGLELYQAPDALGCTLHEDGTHFFTYRDLDRELRELRRHFGAADAEGYLAFGAAMQRVGAVLEPALLHRPPSAAQLEDALRQTGGDDLWQRFFVGSVGDLLDRYFHSDLLKAYLAFPALVSVFGGPHTDGTAYVLTHHAVSEFEGTFGQWGFARGGLGAVATALAASATDHGAAIRTDAPVERILVRDGRAHGVQLASGERIEARYVLSNADPKRTLLGLVGADALDPAVVAELERYDVSGSMARMHIATDVLPRFAGVSGDGVGPEHLGHNLLGPTMERYERAWTAQRAGHLFEDPVVELLVESAREPDAAPPGHHLLLAGVQQLPRELAGRSWDDARGDLEEVILRRLYAHAPNLEGHVIATHVLTPLDLEREYGLSGGNIYHGALGLDQLFDRRPAYGTPIGGLLLCGSGTHPGGGVMGAPGHNAAMTLLTHVDPSIAWNGYVAPRPDGLERLTYAVARRPGLRRLAAAAGRQRWLRPVLRRATRKER